MKYIDADKLIEKLKHYLDIQPSTDGLSGKYSYEARGVKQAIDYAFSLVKELQQEQPEVDLEKEISDTCRSYRIRGDFDGTELNRHDIENIARHFYELGLNARK